MVEVFLDIKGFESDYQISNYGRVRSLNYNHTGETRVLKPKKRRDGYLQIDLYKNGKHNYYRVHRLVAEAFIPNPYGLPFVNHKDECKSNNRADNLEWCDRKYNVNYGTAIERRTEKQRNDPNQSKRVYQYAKSGSFVRSYPSLHEAARQTGINNGHISACCRGYKYKSAGGYIWSFIPPTPTTTRVLF